MKNQTARILSLLLVLLTAVGIFTACAKPEPGTDPTVTTPVRDTAEETRITHDLPPMTFDDYTFGMLHWYIDGWEVTPVDLYAEENTGDPINDEVYKRNSRLEESLKITFELDELPYNEVVDKIRQSVRSGDDFYDIYYARLTDSSTVLQEGAFLDFNSDLPYVDLSKPYWDQSVQEDISFGGHLFLAASDINITDKNATDSYLFNKALVRDYELPNFYDIVDEGAWTFDALYENMTSFDGDMNGDGKLDPEDDIMGFLGAADVTMSLFYGGGGHFITKDEYDLPENDFNTEENIDLVMAIFDIMYDETFINAHKYDTSYTDDFIAGHGLFYWSRLQGVVRLRGEESIDFGILPTPKYDESQSEYLSMISEHLTGLCGVLTTESEPETVSYILEAMAAGSHYDLQKAYYDITLKTKSARDDESQAMLDIIFAHRTLDLGELCQFGGFPNVLLYFPNQVGTYDIVSKYESMESKIEQSIAEFIEKVDQIELERG